MDKTAKITALYARTNQSNPAQDYPNNIHAQTDFLKKYALENGFENITVFADDGFSVHNFDRPQWMRLVDEVKKGNVETIIIKNMSRMGRKFSNVMAYEEMFTTKGVRLISITDNVDSSVPDGISKIREAISAFMAQKPQKA